MDTFVKTPKQQLAQLCNLSRLPVTTCGMLTMAVLRDQTKATDLSGRYEGHSAKVAHLGNQRRGRLPPSALREVAPFHPSLVSYCNQQTETGQHGMTCSAFVQKCRRYTAEGLKHPGAATFRCYGSLYPVKTSVYLERSQRSRRLDKRHA